MAKIGSGMGVAGPVSLSEEQLRPQVDNKHVPGKLGGMEVQRASISALSRPHPQSVQDDGPPLGERHVQQLPGSPNAGQMTRQQQYAPLLQATPVPANARSAAAQLVHSVELQPSRFLSEFGSQLRAAHPDGLDENRFIDTLDGLLDGFKAASGGTLSKDQLSAYLAFASHLPDMGAMQSALRANLCLSRLAVALGADVNALMVAHNAESSVDTYIASTMVSLAAVLHNQRPQDAAGLFAVALSHANPLDRQPMVDGVLTRLMAQHSGPGDPRFKALATGLLQGSGVREAGSTQGAQAILDGLIQRAAAQQPQGQPDASPALLDLCKVLGQELHHLGRDPLRQPEEEERLEATIQRHLQPPASPQAVKAFRDGRAALRPQPVPADSPLGPPPDMKAQSADDKRIAQARRQYDHLMDRIKNSNPHQENAQHLMSDIIACAVKLHKVDPSWPTELMVAMKQRLGGDRPDKALVTMCLNKFADAALNETLNPNKDNWELLTDTEKQELESRNFFSSKTHRSLGVDHDETVLRSLMSGFTQALGGDDMSDEIWGHCLKVVTNLNYLTLDAPESVAPLIRGLGYRTAEYGPDGRDAAPRRRDPLTESERAKILVATKLFPEDWKLDPSAAARRAARSAASANQPAAPAVSPDANSITSKLTQSIGQGRAFEAGREMVTARRKNEIKPAELKQLAQQIVASLYQGPEWRVRVDAFMRGWAAQARVDTDDADALPAEEVLDAIVDAAEDDANATSEEQSKHLEGFVKLASHLLRKDFAGATVAFNDLRASDLDEASWSAFIAPTITQ